MVDLQECTRWVVVPHRPKKIFDNPILIFYYRKGTPVHMIGWLNNKAGLKIIHNIVDAIPHSTNEMANKYAELYFHACQNTSILAKWKAPIMIFDQ